MDDIWYHILTKYVTYDNNGQLLNIQLVNWFFYNIVKKNRIYICNNALDIVRFLDHCVDVELCKCGKNLIRLLEHCGDNCGFREIDVSTRMRNGVDFVLTERAVDDVLICEPRGSLHDFFVIYKQELFRKRFSRFLERLMMLDQPLTKLLSHGR